MKKFFTYPVFLVLFLSFIGAMGFGAVVKYHYDGGKKFQFLQKSVMLISSVPVTLRIMTKYTSVSGDVIVPINETIFKDLKVFDKKLVTPPPRKFNTYLSS